MPTHLLRISLILMCLWHGDAFGDLFVLDVNGFSSKNVLRYGDETGAFSGNFIQQRIVETAEGMRWGTDGNLYVTANSLGYGGVYCFDGTGRLLRSFFPTNMWGPKGIAFGPDGYLYVCAFRTNYSNFYVGGPALFVLNRTSGVAVAKFPMPALYDIVVSKSGLMVASGWDIFRTNGSVFATVEGGARCLAFGPDGHLYVSASQSNSVVKLDGTNGTFLSTFVTPRSGEFYGLEGLDFGPDGHLYVASYRSNAVFRYNGATGLFIDQFVPRGSGGLSSVRTIQFATIPRLRIERIGTDTVTAWPAALTNFQLEFTSAFTGLNSWQSVTNPMGVIGRERVFTNDNLVNRFYRLRSQ